MDELESRLTSMGKLLLEMALEYDEMQEELVFWRRAAIISALLNVGWFGVFIWGVLR